MKDGFLLVNGKFCQFFLSLRVHPRACDDKFFVIIWAFKLLSRKRGLNYNHKPQNYQSSKCYPNHLTVLNLGVSIHLAELAVYYKSLITEVFHNTLRETND